MSQALNSELRDEWYRKLADSGFKDIEDLNGNLNQYDRRTIAFDNRDLIQKFFIRLDHYLTDNPNIPLLHMSVLTLYSEGKFIGEICDKVLKGRTTVKQIIYAYKKLLIG